jgi:protease-4
LALSTADAQRLQIPEGVFYFQPASSVFGPEAVWVNPAGLARYKSAGFQILADYADDEFAKSWGWVISRDRLSTAYRRLEVPDGDDYQEWVFAAAMSLGSRVHLGGSYRYFKDAPGFFDNKHFWNLGLLGQYGAFRWGAVFENLNNSGTEDGQESDTEMRYSLAYRPFGPRLTLSADMMLSTGTRLSNADYIYHANYDVGKGIYLNGYYDTDDNFQLGFRVNLAQYFVGAKSRFDDGDHTRTTAILGATSRRQKSIIPPQRRRLTVGIAGDVGENPVHVIFGQDRIAYARLLLQIHRAAKDPSIDELVVNLKGTSLGLGRAQELRRAISEFRRQGKRVICHISHAGNLDYYVASAADRILIDPVARLRLVGLRAELTFYAGAMDKLGIDADIVRIGKYKSAPEQYMFEQSSEEYRKELGGFLDDLYNQFTAAIAEGRGLGVDSIKGLIDQGPFTSQEAREYGLVDGLSYRDEIEDHIGTRPSISFRGYMGDTLANDGWPPRPRIAMVVADGEVEFADGVSPFGLGEEGVTPQGIQKGFDAAMSDPNVRAVILRVNSPGGMALAGEEIHHSIEKASKRRPLLVSMGNTAASAAYYFSMPGDRLFANPATVTGSIGIYAGKPVLEDLYDKIDLGKELYTRGRMAGMHTMMRPYTEEERQKVRHLIEEFYGHFVDLVADNRELTPDSVDALGRGRVYTGRQAAQAGLVDDLGGLQAALHYAAGRRELSEYDVVIYPRREAWLALPGQSMFNWLVSAIWGKDEREVASAVRSIIPREGLYARMPYDLIIE